MRDDLHKYVSAPRRFQLVIRSLISDAAWETAGPKVLQRALLADARDGLPERFVRRARRLLAEREQGRIVGDVSDDLRALARGGPPIQQELAERTIAIVSRAPGLGPEALERAMAGLQRDQVARLRRTADADLARRAPGDRRTILARLDAAANRVDLDSVARHSLGAPRPSGGERPVGRFDYDADLPRTNG